MHDDDDDDDDNNNNNNNNNNNTTMTDTYSSGILEVTINNFTF